jgi:hypothetical protein
VNNLPINIRKIKIKTTDEKYKELIKIPFGCEIEIM